MLEERFTFRLRDAEGSVSVSFEANEDPERWGYGVLGMEWPTEIAKGLPVLTARTEVALDGYAAVMGWVQIVRIEVLEASASLVAGGEKAPAGQHEWVDGVGFDSCHVVWMELHEDLLGTLGLNREDGN